MKRFHPGAIVIAAWACAWAAGTFAAEIFVTPSGTGDGSSWASPTNSLQGAINAIPTGIGNTVWVGDGLYDTGGITNWPAGSTHTNRMAITKAITVRSLNGSTATTIKGAWDPVSTNGPAAVRGVYMAAGSALIGFTITNGAGPLVIDPPDGVDPEAKRAGGIWCANNTTTIISNCVIVGNAADKSGGGVYRGILYNGTLSGNRCMGGTAGGSRDSTLINCTVTGNTAASGGGTRGATLYNCLVSGNTANNIGGVYFGGVFSSTVVGNRATGAGGVGGVYAASYLHNSIVYFNTGPGGVTANWGLMSTAGRWVNNCTTPTNTAAGMWTAGHTTADPRFVDQGAGNYRLLASSPCVDGGAMASFDMVGYPKFAKTWDLDGHPRIWPAGGQLDIGAFETLYRRGSVITIK